MVRRVAIVTAYVVLLGCGGPRPVAPDAGRTDAAAPDASAVEAVTSASAQGTTEPAPAAPPPGPASVLTVDAPLRGTHAEKAPVVVVRGDDPADLVKRALDGVAPRIPKDARVIVKVNAGGFDRLRPGRADDGVTGRITNPAFVRALLLELRARGVRDLAIADGQSTTREDFEKLLAHTGYTAIAREVGVPFLDLNHYGEGDPRPRPWRMRLPWAKLLSDELLLSDDLVNPGRPIYLIDVPKLKMHRFAVASLSIKNLMGAVMIADDAARTPPHRLRHRMHRELSPWLAAWKERKADDREQYRRALATFSERLADLYGVLTPDLVLIEGLPAMQGDGFAHVVPYGGEGIVIASRNGCYADWIAAEFLGLSDSAALEAELGVRAPPAILAVAERYYGGLPGLSRIVVQGDLAWRKRPASAWFRSMAPFELNRPPR
jgi:uncharacterized protein (DUF362 family)